jgi:hypothetical protein
MKKLLLLVITALALTALSACVIVPPYAYPYYGESHRHYDHDGGWGRHW